MSSVEYSGPELLLSTAETLKDLKLKVALSLRSPKCRMVTRFVECGSGKEKVVYHNSVNNLMAAIMGRVYYVKVEGNFIRPPPPTDLRKLKKFLGKISCFVNYGGRMSYSDFVDHRSGPKKQAYQNELDTLFIRETNSRDTIAKFFIKDELMDYEWTTSGYKMKCPRVIRPQGVRLNLLLGVHIQPLEKAVYRALDRYFSRKGGVRRTVTKGLNVFAIADLIKRKWSRFKDPVCVQFDCERFSQHNHIDVLDVMSNFLVKMVGENTSDGADLREQLNHQRVIRFLARSRDGTITGKIVGTLSDGVMNTSLYGVTLMCAMIDTACKISGKRAELFSAGDDTNAIMERSDWDAIRDTIPDVGTEFGFRIKVESIEDRLEDIKFCRMQPVFDGAKWRMVRQIEDSLARDICTVKPVESEKFWDELRAAKAHCGLALTSGLPVLQAFYLMLGRGTHGFRSSALDHHSGMYQMSQGLESKVAPVSDEARLSFYRAFGLHPERQIALEEFYGTLNPSYSRRCELSFQDTFIDSRLYYV
jgi:hypothetical protein